MNKKNIAAFWVGCTVLVFFLLTCDISHSQDINKNMGKSDEDKCIHIDDLNLIGNKTFSQARLKMRMKTWHSSFMPGNLNCFNKKWLQKDIHALVEFYRKKGFPDIDIIYTLNGRDKNNHDTNNDSEKTPSPVDGGNRQKFEKISTIIVVEIREGFKYELVFKGNTFFSKKNLQKKINLVQKGNINDSALKKGKLDIRQLYLDAGFKDVSVEFKKEKRMVGKSEIQHVEYLVNEGRQAIVNQLVIMGNEKVEQEEILAVMLIRQKGMIETGGYNASVLKKDIKAIELLYLSKGFLNVHIVNKVSLLDGTLLSDDMELPEKQSKDTPALEKQSKDTVEPDAQTKYMVDIRIDIAEGIQTLVATARITGLGDIMSVDEALSRVSLKPGEPFREYMITSDENLLGMLVSEKGYPHVKVQASAVLNEDKSRVDLLWHVEPGIFTRFGDITYTGNTRLKQDVIEKRIDIITGEPFSLKKVFVTEQQIRESSAVKYVRIKAPGLKHMQETPDIEVEIEENIPYFVEAAIGYDTEQIFYLDTKIGDNNFLGREINAWAAAKISGIGYRAETGLAKPYLWGTDINSNYNIYAEDEEELNQGFGTKSWGFEAVFIKPLSVNKVTTGLNLKYENRNTYGDVDPEEQEARNILITSLSFGYDSRDSSLRPSKGLLSTASVDLFAGFDNELDRFLKYKIDFRKYLSPFNHVTFALRTRMGYIQPLGTGEKVAQDQLFFLGGTSDVRGFDENMLDYDPSGDPAGGRTSINSSLEARMALPAQFELSCFLDTGRIDEMDSSVESKGFRSALGVGLRYITPIGPVGLLYGHKLDPEEGEDSGRIHLSVGYTF